MNGKDKTRKLFSAPTKKIKSTENCNGLNGKVENPTSSKNEEKKMIDIELPSQSVTEKLKKNKAKQTNKTVPKSLTDEEYSDLFNSVLSKTFDDEEVVHQGSTDLVEPNVPKTESNCEDELDVIASVTPIDEWNDRSEETNHKHKNSPFLKKEKKEKIKILTNSSKKEKESNKDVNKKDSHRVIDERKATEKSDKESDEEEESESGTWIQCSLSDCGKWRYVEDIDDPADVPDDWDCSMNSDEKRNSCNVAEQEYDESEHILTKFTLGSIVWAKMDGFPWWPGMIDTDPDYDTYFELATATSMIPCLYHVTFFDDHVSRAWMRSHLITPYDKKSFPRNSVTGKSQYSKRDVKAAISNAESALKLTLQDRLDKYSFLKRYSRSKRVIKSVPERKSKKEKKNFQREILKSSDTMLKELETAIETCKNSDDSVYSEEDDEYLPQASRSRQVFCKERKEAPSVDKELVSCREKKEQTSCKDREKASSTFKEKTLCKDKKYISHVKEQISCKDRNRDSPPNKKQASGQDWKKASFFAEDQKGNQDDKDVSSSSSESTIQSYKGKDESKYQNNKFDPDIFTMELDPCDSIHQDLQDEIKSLRGSEIGLDDNNNKVNTQASDNNIKTTTKVSSDDPVANTDALICNIINNVSGEKSCQTNKKRKANFLSLKSNNNGNKSEKAPKVDEDSLEESTTDMDSEKENKDPQASLEEKGDLTMKKRKEESQLDIINPSKTKKITSKTNRKSTTKDVGTCVTKSDEEKKLKLTKDGEGKKSCKSKKQLICATNESFETKHLNKKSRDNINIKNKEKNDEEMKNNNVNGIPIDSNSKKGEPDKSQVGFGVKQISRSKVKGFVNPTKNPTKEKESKSNDRNVPCIPSDVEKKKTSKNKSDRDQFVPDVTNEFIEDELDFSSNEIESSKGKGCDKPEAKQNKDNDKASEIEDELAFSMDSLDDDCLDIKVHHVEDNGMDVDTTDNTHEYGRFGGHCNDHGSNSDPFELIED